MSRETHRARATPHLWTGSIYDQLVKCALAGDNGDFLIVQSPDETWRTFTHHDIASRADAVSGVLHERGVGPGDRVLLQLENSWQFLACVFGIARIGAVAVPTNPLSTIDDFAYVASHAGCLAAIVDADRAPDLLDGLDMVPEVSHLLSAGTEQDGVESLEIAMTGVEHPGPHHKRSDSDVACIFYTSGTTGWPKGVMLTDANLAYTGSTVAESLDVGPLDRWLITLPLFHYNAFGISLMSALRSGASIILSDGELSRWPSVAYEHRATLGSLFGRHMRTVLSNTATEFDEMCPVRLVLFAQDVAQTERLKFEQRFDCAAVQFYGMTETVGMPLVESTTRPRAEMSVGEPTPWWNIALRGSDEQPVRSGEEGELWIAGEPGHSLFAGYVSDTNHSLSEGWFRTGDRLRINSKGLYEFRGRVDDVMKPGVDNVSAAEVERVLLEHPSVDDAVVAAHVPRTGEQVIAAWVVARAGDDVTINELRTWSQERLAPHKVPEEISVVDAIPRTAVGKVRWRELRPPSGS